MTKAEALALLEYNAQPKDYISKEEFDDTLREGIKANVELDAFTKSLLYNADLTSFMYNNMQYICICIMKQDWHGDWDDESTIYFKQKRMTHEEMVSLMNYTADLQDFDVE